MNNFILKIAKNKLAVIVLLLILAVGIFLRSYNFSEWLRFNADQARDVKLAISSADNKTDLPLLGPKAGGTNFRLGPIFYYFQIASVKIFGNEPYKAAYPDLFFSILSIPLFFLLARTCFNSKISLALTWLFAISYFMVKFSRFAWNPNSTPFFVMLYLYSLYKIIISEKEKKSTWAVVAGISLGIAVQLHTSLLIILPIMTMVIVIFLLKKEKIKLTAIALLLISAIFMNVPQVISEIKTRGSNSYQLILGVTEKNGRNSNISKNILLNFSCHIKSNSHIISALGNEDKCEYSTDLKTIKKFDSKKMSPVKKISFVLFLVISAIFSLGGYILLFRKLHKESDEKNKIMLALLSVYVSISFLFFFIWATELSVRFFLVLSFVPFFLLGFWISFLSEKFKKEKVILVLSILVLSFFNLQKIYGTYGDLNNGGREINGDFDYATLGEENFIIDFMRENSNGEKTLYLDAQAGYLFKMLRPLQFLAEKYGLTLVELREEIKLENDSRLFYLKSADAKCELPEKTLKKYEMEKCVMHGQLSIFSLRVK